MFNMGNLTPLKETESNLKPRDSVQSNLVPESSKDDIWDQGVEEVHSNLDFFGKIQLATLNLSGEFECYVKLVAKNGINYSIDLMVIVDQKRYRYMVDTLYCPLPFTQTFKGSCVIVGGSWSRVTFKGLE